MDSLLQVPQAPRPGCIPFRPTRKLRLGQVEVSCPGCGCGCWQSLEKGPGVLEGPRGTSRGFIQVTHLTPEAATIPLGAGRPSPQPRRRGAVLCGQPHAHGAPQSTGGHGHCPRCRLGSPTSHDVGARIPGGKRSVWLGAPCQEQASPWKGGVPEASPGLPLDPGVESSLQTNALGLTGDISLWGPPLGPGGQQEGGPGTF